MSLVKLIQEETILETQGNNDTDGPKIEGERDFMEDDVVEDKKKELLKDDLWRLQKVDSVATISSLRMKLNQLFCLQIPLCRLMAMPMVKPILSCDLVKLEQEFVNGYQDGASFFYITTTNEAGESLEFLEEIDVRNLLWKEKNDIFNKDVDSVPHLKFLKNLKFFICDGNHHRLAWMNHISKCHSNDHNLHCIVDSILLETKGKIEFVMHVMHDINKGVLNLQ